MAAGTQDGPVGVVSPHLDDAVYSCGSLLCRRPGSHVVTVFTAGGRGEEPLAPWDEASGIFKRGDDVMSVRREEDLEALAHAGAQAHHLGFWDNHYRLPPKVYLSRLRRRAQQAAKELAFGALEVEVREAIARQVHQLDVATWFIPLGLWHVDHRLVAAACTELARCSPELGWVVYEELPYRRRLETEAAELRRALVESGFGLEALPPEGGPVPGAGACKQVMVECYRSQAKPMGEGIQLVLDSGESFFRLSTGRPAHD
ncbi:MAG TPA: PIG-L family deacetylase [Acidimicrobiales bacterium]|nr:PIG-L family deacetylase [Acidimicrobiales bacterium]